MGERLYERAMGYSHMVFGEANRAGLGVEQVEPSSGDAPDLFLAQD